MSVRTRIGSFLGFVAGAICSLFGKGPAKPTTEDARRIELSGNTQRLGIRFTERIRSSFRRTWIKRR